MSECYWCERQFETEDAMRTHVLDCFERASQIAEWKRQAKPGGGIVMTVELLTWCSVCGGDRRKWNDKLGDYQQCGNCEGDGVVVLPIDREKLERTLYYFSPPVPIADCIDAIIATITGDAGPTPPAEERVGPAEE